MRHIGRMLIIMLLLATVTGFAVATGQGEAEEPEISTEIETISWYYFGFDAGPDTEEVVQAINEYIEPEIYANLELVPLDWDPFLTQTNVKLAANEPYDIVFSPVWIDFFDGISRNKYMDITEMFYEYAPNTADLLGESVYAGYFDGVMYAIPTLKEQSEAYVIMFNTELVDKYDLMDEVQAVDSAADLAPILEVIAESEPDVIPFDVSGLTLSKTAGLDFVTGDDTLPIATEIDDTEIKVVLEHEAYVEALRVQNQLFRDGIISADAAVQDQARLDTLKEQGRVFSFVDGGGGLPDRAASLSNENVTWMQVYITQPIINNKVLRGSMNSISSTSRHPEKALMFLDLLNTDPYLNNLLAFGIEGEHYEVIDDERGIVERIPDSGYSHDWQWAFANQFINYIKSTEDPDRWEKIAEINESAAEAQSLGFDVDLDDYDNTVQAMKLIMSESGLTFVDGDFDTAVQDIIDQLYDAGAQELIDFVQAEYDAFLATK